MGALEPGHLIVIMLIVLVIFGPGKLADLGGQLGRGVREVRQAMDGKAVTPALRSPNRQCSQCGSPPSADARFCVECGHALDAAA